MDTKRHPSTPAGFPSLQLLWPLLIGLLTACEPPKKHDLTAQGSPAESTDIVATVGPRVIRSSQLQQEVQRRHDRGDTAEPSVILQDLIQRESLLAYAQQIGLDREASVVRACEDLLIARLKARETLAPKASINEARTDVVRTSPTRALPPSPQAKSSVSQIRFAVLRQQTPPRISEARRQEARQRLESALARARTLPPETVGFGALAVEHSDDDTTRFQGGDVGWMPEDAGRLRHDPEMLRAAFALRDEGEFSPVIAGRDGWYAVRLIGRRAPPRSTELELDENLAEPSRVRRQNAELALLERVRNQIPVRILTP